MPIGSDISLFDDMIWGDLLKQMTILRRKKNVNSFKRLGWKGVSTVFELAQVGVSEQIRNKFWQVIGWITAIDLADRHNRNEKEQSHYGYKPPDCLRDEPNPCCLPKVEEVLDILARFQKNWVSEDAFEVGQATTSRDLTRTCGIWAHDNICCSHHHAWLRARHDRAPEGGM